MVGPEESVRLAYAAQRYHLEGKSRIDIAQELGVSRFKVARMLDRARELGIVDISVRSPGPIDPVLSRRLQESYGLRRAIAVAVPTDEADLVAYMLGGVTGQLLVEVLRPGDVLGLTAGRTLGAMARRLNGVPSCDVVQLCGAAGPINSSAVDVIRRVNLAAGGEAYCIHSPMILADARAAGAMRREPEIARTRARFADLTIAVTAIGSWRPVESQLAQSPSISPERRRRLNEAGVQADLGPVLLDAEGRVVTMFANATIGIGPDQLRAVPDVIAVGGGTRKTDAVRAVLRSGLVGSLVTDTRTAALLAAEGRSDERRGLT